jgi:hypothetical protein
MKFVSKFKLEFFLVIPLNPTEPWMATVIGVE